MLKADAEYFTIDFLLNVFQFHFMHVDVQRVQQLQSCMEDASNRLMPAETARSQWISPTDLSPPMIQEQLDQLKVYFYLLVLSCLVICHLFVH